MRWWGGPTKSTRGVTLQCVRRFAFFLFFSVTPTSMPLFGFICFLRATISSVCSTAAASPFPPSICLLICPLPPPSFSPPLWVLLPGTELPRASCPRTAHARTRGRAERLQVRPREVTHTHTHTHTKAAAAPRDCTDVIGGKESEKKNTHTHRRAQKKENEQRMEANALAPHTHTSNGSGSASAFSMTVDAPLGLFLPSFCAAELHSAYFVHVGVLDCMGLS